MSQASFWSTVLYGLDVHPVRIDVTTRAGIPRDIRIQGMSEAAARETRVRIGAALASMGAGLLGRVDVVLSADVPLRDVSLGALDLPIAVGILLARGTIKSHAAVEGRILLGELALTGEIRQMRGLFAHLRGAARHGFDRAIVPAANGAEAASAGDALKVFVARTLRDVVDHLTVERGLERAEPVAFEASPKVFGDMMDLTGPDLRRALEISAAGGHNLLMLGPPGAGKTMAARRLSGILPTLGEAEARELTAIHSAAGLVNGEAFVRTRPFRAPHHTVSETGLLGGGKPIRPGEVTLAHHGVLFLDELTEFRRPALESLRTAWRDGVVTFGREARAVMPARPLVVGSASLCPCGHRGYPKCHCTPGMVRAHVERIGALGIFDLCISLEPITVARANLDPIGDDSATVRGRVMAARHFASTRRIDYGSPAASRVRVEVVQRVARTIANLAGTADVQPEHLVEANGLVPAAKSDQET